MKIRLFFYSLVFCLLASFTQAKELNLSIDKNVIVEGDSLVLTITYDGNSNDTPDLSSIKQNFNIISNSSSQQFNFINGNASHIKKWSFELVPLKTGKIYIAPIKMDNLYSNDAEIEVKEMSNVAYVPDSRQNSNSPYFQIEQEFDVTNPYVQQQVTFFVHIYDSIGLQNGAPTISNEAQKNWIIVPLTNKPIVRQETINHKHMNVETYAFAAFPQKSGNIAVPQVSFEGFYVKTASFGFPNFEDDINIFGVDFHNVFGQRVPVRMKTKEKTINVLPVPADSLSASWLPLNNLELSSKWAENSKFKTGEAISRTVTLKATGMTQSMLPQISFPEIIDFKQYPEQPIITEEIVNGKIVTTASYNNVYIPKKSGKLTIPQLKMQWFNVDTKKLQTAILPAENIDIIPCEEELLSNKENPLKKEQNLIEKDTENKKSSESQKNLTQDIVSFKTSLENLGISQKAILPFSMLIGVIVLFLFISFLQRKKHLLRNNIIKAIKKHDYKKAKECLLVWATYKFGQNHIQNFSDVIKYAQNVDFSYQLSLLNKILYSNSEDYFDGIKFIEVLKKVDKIKCKENKKINNALPNLYD